MNIIYFMSGVLLPYFAEKYAYRQFISVRDGQSADTTISHAYGWRVLWDASYFFILLYTTYRIIFRRAPVTWMEWVGYIIFLGGVILRIFALRSLGQFYDAGIAIRTDHEIVRAGPYHILRHPLHMGTLFKIMGLSLFCPLWLALPAVLSSFLLVLNLNRTEDRIHLLEFDSSFKEYYRSTWDVVDLFFWKNKMK